jgi:hypothetical protein
VALTFSNGKTYRHSGWSTDDALTDVGFWIGYGEGMWSTAFKSKSDYAGAALIGVSTTCYFEKKVHATAP